VITPGFTSVKHLIIATTPPDVTATLPGTPASVPVARRLVREVLVGCPRAGDLMLAATELATNAINHSASGRGGSFTVRLRTGPGRARVEVIDEGSAQGRSPASNGWGLEIVAGITDEAGAIIGPDGCRTAWAEVTWPAHG
jgi:two-component sensor histidine kinase